MDIEQPVVEVQDPLDDVLVDPIEQQPSQKITLVSTASQRQSWYYIQISAKTK